jgi:hypothetical protein
MRDNTSVIVVDEFPRNDREVVRVVIDQYRGHHMIQIRNFYLGSSGDWLPGKGGIGMSARHLPRLATAINAALAEAQRAGMIDSRGGGDD